MEPQSSTPTPPVLSQGRAIPDVVYRVDYQVHPRVTASTGMPVPDTAAAALSAHDDTLVPAALEEIETQRVHVERLLEAGVLGNCLSD